MQSIHEKILLDEEDKYLLKKYTFCDDGKGYPITNLLKIDGKRTSIRLHQLILPRIEGLEIDHINRIKTDNRRCNLRHVTHSQNNLNKLTQCNNTSGYRGIYWQKKAKKWHAQIMVSGRQIYLGIFSDKQEAITAYSETQKQLHGNFAPISHLINTNVVK